MPYCCISRVSAMLSCTPSFSNSRVLCVLTVFGLRLRRCGRRGGRFGRTEHGGLPGRFQIGSRRLIFEGVFAFALRLVAKHVE